jgi:hypothetical protein
VELKGLKMVVLIHPNNGNDEGQLWNLRGRFVKMEMWILRFLTREEGFLPMRLLWEVG